MEELAELIGRVLGNLLWYTFLAWAVIGILRWFEYIPW